MPMVGTAEGPNILGAKMLKELSTIVFCSLFYNLPDWEGATATIPPALDGITHFILSCRPVVPGSAEGTMAPPDFAISVNPISTRWGRLCPPNNTGTPGFSDLPTALLCLQTNSHRAHCAVCDFAKIFPITINNLLYQIVSRILKFRIYELLSSIFSAVENIS